MAQHEQRSKITSSQRMTVRIALATGATVAALIGAQSLALAGRSGTAVANNPVANPAVTDQGNSIFFGDDQQSNTFQQDDGSQSFGRSSFRSSIQSASNQPNPFTQASR